MSSNKLSPTAINTFLRSPKSFYYQYVLKIAPVQQSVATYDHDKLCGILWAEFVDRFYKGASEEGNTKVMLLDWADKTDGWVPEKAKAKLTTAMTTWAAAYYQTFDPRDGCRAKSELHLEDDHFHGYLDGLSEDEVVHEVKSTSRSICLSDQLWKVQNSIQVKLYAVLAKATGIRIEFAFKDPPFAIWRSDIQPVTQVQLKQWKQELDSIHAAIVKLGSNPDNYVCHSDGCNLVTRGVTSMCPFQILCEQDYNEVTQIGFKTKTQRQR